MGFFSFLTGSKDERADKAGEGRAATSSESTPSSADAASGEASPQSPFTPPEAWDIDTSALTAPPPKTEDHPKIGEVDPA